MQAVKDAGLEIDDAWRCGSIIATGAGGIRAHEITINKIYEGRLNDVSPFYIVSVIPNTATSHLALEMGMHGPTFSINSACASANHAFGISILMMRAGMVDVMLAGGTEAALNAPGMTSFGSISALSTRNDEPHLASRPFDVDRDGFTMGEGAGVLVFRNIGTCQKTKRKNICRNYRFRFFQRCLRSGCTSSGRFGRGKGHA